MCEKCDCKEEVTVAEVEMMDVVFENENVFHKNPMFRRIPEKVESYRGGYIYIFFNMGSVKLDIDDPINLISFNDGYVEVFNNENTETTFIKDNEILGFVFDNKPVLLDENVESDFDDSDD